MDGGSTERAELVDAPRLGANRSTERYQPHWGEGTVQIQAIDRVGPSGPVAVIRRGPLGYGASYSMAEPVGSTWHEMVGPVPMVSRSAGA